MRELLKPGLTAAVLFTFLSLFVPCLLKNQEWQTARAAEPSIPASPCAHTPKDEKATITVTGEATEYLIPDTALITLGVETVEKTADEAVTGNSVKSEKLVREMKKLIDQSSKDSIKTSSYTVQPAYEYDQTGKKNVLTGYRVTNQVTVRTKKTDWAGKIIDSAIRSGANQIHGLTFTLSDEKEHCADVLKKASARAEKEAALVARALGTRVTGIRSISPSCGTEVPRPVFRQTMAETARAASLSESIIEAGDIPVRASVSIVFSIEKE